MFDVLVTGAGFVKPALFVFDNEAAVRFFEQRNVSLLKREDKKVFPRSLDSRYVLSGLQDFFAQQKI
jgi:predicted flavoprotein YhiN